VRTSSKIVTFSSVLSRLMADQCLMRSGFVDMARTAQACASTLSGRRGEAGSVTGVHEDDAAGRHYSLACRMHRASRSTAGPGSPGDPERQRGGAKLDDVDEAATLCWNCAVKPPESRLGTRRTRGSRSVLEQVRVRVEITRAVTALPRAAALALVDDAQRATGLNLKPAVGLGSANSGEADGVDRGQVRGDVHPGVSAILGDPE
jgi:hypothetical protein